MVEILSIQYKLAFSKPKEDYSNINFIQANCPLLEDIEITIVDIKEAANSMDPNSASGPDGIPPFTIKEHIDILARPLMKMWRLSLDTGKMPEGIIQAIITPIFKGGDRSSPPNYRPVALTNHTTKIFESTNDAPRN